MTRTFWRALGLVLMVLAAPAQAEDTHWVGSWASSQLVPGADTALSADVTLRQVVRLSAGGTRVRVRLSNVFGQKPLRIGAAHIAHSPDALSSCIGEGRSLTFNGLAQATIPAGAEYLSDPVDLTVGSLTDVAISLYLPEAAAPQTGHPGARSVTWLVKGNHVAASQLENPQAVERWFHIASVDVRAQGAAIVALGDSITDGFGVKPGTYARWTDRLAQRLQDDPRTRHLSVLNHGIGGGALIRGGTGPNAMARFDRDVLSQTGVRYLMIFIGVNDLGGLAREGGATPESHAELVDGMIGAYGQIIRRAKEKGIRVYGATILPFTGSDYYNPGAATEADRQRINSWIRQSGAFDAVIDLDKALADPQRPDRLKPEFDSGDHLHPSFAGYRAIGDAIDLSLFE